MLEEGYESDEINPEIDFKNWNEDLDMLLESLLELFTFDFEKVYKEFQRALQENNIKDKKFTIKDLRKRWTYLEILKFRSTNSKDDQKAENVKLDELE